MPKQKLFVADDYVGNYKIEALLGDGGEGYVYEVRDSAGHHFALKMPRNTPATLSSDPRLRHAGRLERESKALQALAREAPSPYLLPVHDVGTHEGIPFFVMELVQGETLPDYLDQQAPDLPRRVELFAGIARAVALLHARGVCHRDLKPANILVRSNGEPVLIDFGLVKAEWLETLGTATPVMGTVPYMSPEYIVWANDVTTAGPYPFGPRDDVYALGVTFYEMLTGKRPYDVRPPRGPQYLAELFRRSSGPPRPRELEYRIPEPINAFIMRLLARNAADRPSSAIEVVSELARARDEAGPHWQPPTERVDRPISSGASQPAQSDHAPAPVVIRRYAARRLARAFGLGLLCMTTGGLLTHFAAAGCATVPLLPDGLPPCSPEALAATKQLNIPESSRFNAEIVNGQPGSRNGTSVLRLDQAIEAEVDFPPHREGKLPVPECISGGLPYDPKCLETVVIPRGAMLYGRARPDGERVQIRFERLRFPDGREQPFCAMAYSIRDGLPGLPLNPPEELEFLKLKQRPPPGLAVVTSNLDIRRVEEAPSPPRPVKP